MQVREASEAIRRVLSADKIYLEADEFPPARTHSLINRSGQAEEKPKPKRLKRLDQSAASDGLKLVPAT